MTKKMSLIMIGFVLLVMTLACGPSQQQKAMQTQLAQAKAKNASLESVIGFVGDICSSQNGDQANSLYAKFGDALANNVEMSVSTTQSYVAHCVKKAYVRQADQTFVELRRTHRDDRRAADLIAEYQRCMKMAGRDIPVSMERRLQLELARNKKEAGSAIERAHGVRSRSSVAKKHPGHNQ